MTRSTLEHEVADYVAAVRAALHDLSDQERDEATQDLDAHLAEVAAELGPDTGTDALRERLGPPEAYAAQLREAAGYGRPGAEEPGGGPPKRLRLAVGYVAYTVGALAVAWALLAQRQGLAVVAFGTTVVGAVTVLTAIRYGLPASLQSLFERRRAGVIRASSWLVWVLRAVGANVLLAAFMQVNGLAWGAAFSRGGGTFYSGGPPAWNVPPWDYFTYWPFFQGYLAGAILAVSVVVSIVLGLRGRKRHRGSLILVAPVNLVLIASIAGAYVFGPFIWP